MIEEGKRQFLEEVFPAELEEIRRRRQVLGLDNSTLEGPPSAEIGLVGLALSGGGIRSATFSLGVIEALSKQGVLKKVDYLSTVSGGGYIGSCLSSVLNDPDKEPQGKRFPFHHEFGVEEPQPFRHLRNGSNYLAPRGLMNKFRLPMLFVRGLVLNFLLFLPLIVLAVQFTELAYELGNYSGMRFQLVALLALAAFLFLVVTYPLVSRILHLRLGWSQRDRYERILTLAFIVSLLLIIWLPVSLLLGGVAGISWYDLQQSILSEVKSPLDAADYWKWLLVLAVLVSLLFVGRASEQVARWSGKLLLYLVGLLGPLILVLTYLVLAAVELDSPFIDGRFRAELDRGEITTVLREVLEHRGLQLSDLAKVSVVRRGRVWHIRDGSEDYVIRFGRGALHLESTDLWDYPNDLIFFGVWAGILLFNVLFIDVNVSSPHGFYRDRLSKLFLFRVTKNGEIEPNDGQKLSELNSPGTRAPYQLINTALNLHGSTDPNLRGRNAGFFVFSKRFTGGLRTGYCETSRLEEIDSHLNLGTATAISGAAAAPNMGVATIRPLVFIMTLLNIRLGYWLPNPAFVGRQSWVGRLRLFRGAGPMGLLREGVSALHAGGYHVNVSDGGHLENLGVYELLKRRCNLIIAVDAAADPKHTFQSLVKLTSFATIDMGVKIEFDLEDLRKGEDGFSRKHWALGTIHYGEKETGHLLYLKTSMTGDENLYVRNYHAENPLFPQQSIANQFFNETQFEVYRALGYHIANRAFAECGKFDSVRSVTA